MKRADSGDRPARRALDGFFAEDRYESFRRFAAPAAGAHREPDELFCRHLSGSAWTVRHPALPVAPAPYSCQKTLRSEGPDGGAALPDDCSDERACFEAADRLGDVES